MEATVFYAWQSHTPAKANRHLIREAAEAACERISSDESNEWQIAIDSDTRGVAGMCDIPNTILEKIRECDIFLADLTFVGESTSRSNGPQKMPNSNVVFELGYAAKCHGFSALVGIVNEAYGKSEEQVFDIKRRACIAYDVAQDAPRKELAKKRDALSRQLEEVIRLTLNEVIAKRRKEVTQLEQRDFERIRSEHANLLLQGRFHGFSRLPATSIVIQGRSQSEVEFPALHAQLQSIGLNPDTQANSLSWGDDTETAEITLSGLITDAYGGDYQSFKNQYRFTKAGRHDSSGSTPSFIYAASVQKNIVRRVHRYCQLLDSMQVTPPWTVGVSLVGAQGFRLVSEAEESPRTCDEEIIHLAPSTIAGASDAADTNSTARQLRRALDELCRHFGWHDNYWFDSNGNFNVRIID